MKTKQALPRVRLNDTELVVGRKGVGKSTYGNTRAERYPAGKKVLIIDVNGSPAYKHHTLIDDATLLSGRWKKGIVRYHNKDHEAMLENIITLCENKDLWQGGLILFEDCTKYIDPNPGKVIKSFLVDHRMWNADLIFTFHSFKRIPPFFWEMASYVTFFKTQEIFEGPRNENIIPNYHAIAKARAQVMADANERAKRTIPTLI